ncbi:hypothetical protein EIN_036430 [Entamoeba invadens IP1]|uniref:Uncharacterized protein n=1 Tax=Entamoeba invadens IP1 TaxID=370355 RepID=A0A0A1TY29_ENTIV|nr:hypothetical protein EIN_036430 [Entamoeba invadens IP1]ELP86326.1 hypothetical protein EIN_036430 [Entamoeba invadens IP1]|eukprot:XP_004185672.1 hypothetical protein EIN_036430 [Entamoeba invadens IP1]
MPKNKSTVPTLDVTPDQTKEESSYYDEMSTDYNPRQFLSINELKEQLRVSDLYKNAENVTFTLPVSTLFVEHFFDCICDGYNFNIWIFPGITLGLPFPYIVYDKQNRIIKVFNVVLDIQITKFIWRTKYNINKRLLIWDRYAGITLYTSLHNLEGNLVQVRLTVKNGETIKLSNMGLLNPETETHGKLTFFIEIVEKDKCDFKSEKVLYEDLENEKIKQLKKCAKSVRATFPFVLLLTGGTFMYMSKSITVQRGGPLTFIQDIQIFQRKKAVIITETRRFYHVTFAAEGAEKFYMDGGVLVRKICVYCDFKYEKCCLYIDTYNDKGVIFTGILDETRTLYSGLGLPLPNDPYGKCGDLGVEFKFVNSDVRLPEWDMNICDQLCQNEYRKRLYNKHENLLRTFRKIQTEAEQQENNEDNYDEKNEVNEENVKKNDDKETLNQEKLKEKIENEKEDVIDVHNSDDEKSSKSDELINYTNDEEKKKEVTTKIETTEELESINEIDKKEMEKENTKVYNEQIIESDDQKQNEIVTEIETFQNIESPNHVENIKEKEVVVQSDEYQKQTFEKEEPKEETTEEPLYDKNENMKSTKFRRNENKSKKKSKKEKNKNNKQKKQNNLQKLTKTTTSVAEEISSMPCNSLEEQKQIERPISNNKRNWIVIVGCLIFVLMTIIAVVDSSDDEKIRVATYYFKSKMNNFVSLELKKMVCKSFDLKNNSFEHDRFWIYILSFYYHLSINILYYPIAYWYYYKFYFLLVIYFVVIIITTKYETKIIVVNHLLYNNWFDICLLFACLLFGTLIIDCVISVSMPAYF